jgi:hypothetical protein
LQVLLYFLRVLVILRLAFDSLWFRGGSFWRYVDGSSSTSFGSSAISASTADGANVPRYQFLAASTLNRIRQWDRRRSTTASTSTSSLTASGSQPLLLPVPQIQSPCPVATPLPAGKSDAKRGQSFARQTGWIPQKHKYHL